ncbi:proteasome subunit, beta type 9-like [Oryzias latipes]|uniref:proteasome endopeptidase complex n=1 Tax=Oryzias latipes TaxID=8090 RepID=Q8UUL9_ORYLA|nr:proteasome 20S subunit beta 12 [Oryzias latipes]BAB83846.1 PSMB9-like [Oryzias latipes]BAJ07281.1 proteasome subunit, beta type 9-like [Oryzias latipes]
MEKHFTDSRVKGVSTGTTILAAVFDGGVVIGSDSRASIGGEYVSSKTINKVIQVHDRIFCCMAGSLADAQAVTKTAKFQLSFHSIQMESPPLVISAASVLKQLCYNNKEELQAGFITAGWDKKKGPQVYVVSLGGMMISQPVTIGGSGSTYIYGYVDAKYKVNMTREECLQFATNALALAMGRDNVSGGVANLVVITKEGVEHIVIPGDKLPRFSDE